MGYGSQKASKVGTKTTRASVGRTVITDLAAAFADEEIVSDRFYLIEPIATLVEVVPDKDILNKQGVPKRLAAMRSSAANWQGYAESERIFRHYKPSVKARQGYGDDLEKFVDLDEYGFDADTEYRWFEFILETPADEDE
jgi:hypothetical protein